LDFKNMDEVNKTNIEAEKGSKQDVITDDLAKGGDNLKASLSYVANDSNVVEIKDLFKEFQLGAATVNILKGINVSISRGEFVMLMGPSGCGKSTLLHIIYGLEPPTKGLVYIEGESIWEHSKNWRAFFRNQYIGFIPQQAFWLKALTVVENVAISGFIGGRGYRESVERAYKTLQIVGMEEWAHYRPLDLSGGQQQKVSFARAMLLNPKFIIADEPTGNLDQKSGVQLMDLIKKFNEKFGITVLMVTHNPDQIDYATKVIHMVDGVVVDDTKEKSAFKLIKEDA
jgi:putative ABC transport system ATP-binding protein